jgi:hypothetical protein
MRQSRCHAIRAYRPDSTVWARDTDASQYAELQHFVTDEAKWHKVHRLARSMNHSLS